MGIFSGMYDRYVRPICSYLVALSLVMQYVNLQLADNAKARQLTADGACQLKG